MTPDDFWKTYFAWQNGLLSEAEISRYEWVGRYAELIANHSDSTILPYGLSEAELSDRDLWIAAGMVQLVMGQTKAPNTY